MWPAIAAWESCNAVQKGCTASKCNGQKYLSRDEAYAPLHLPASARQNPQMGSCSRLLRCNISESLLFNRPAWLLHIPSHRLALRRAGVFLRNAAVLDKRGGDETDSDDGSVHDEHGMHTAHVRI